MLSTPRFSYGIDKMLDLEIPYIESLRQHPLTRLFRTNRLSPLGWKQFGLERYHAATSFMTLLRAASKHSLNEEYENIHDAIQRNICDELGLTKDSPVPHEDWRVDFYREIGVHVIDDAYAATVHVEEYRNLIDCCCESPITALSAVLYLEVTIPYEFAAILRGCELTFPERFVLTCEDSSAALTRKRRARRYLEDHISHDMKSHFRELKLAMRPLLSEPSIRETVMETFEELSKCKSKLMDAWLSHFMRSQTEAAATW